MQPVRFGGAMVGGVMHDPFEAWHVPHGTPCLFLSSSFRVDNSSLEISFSVLLKISFSVLLPPLSLPWHSSLAEAKPGIPALRTNSQSGK
jgi:hypothetical protein